MANNMTRTLLSKYYGFGSEKRFERLLSTRTDTSVLDILPDNMEALIPKLEEEPSNIFNHNNTNVNVASKSDEMNFSTEQWDRLSKFSSDEILAADDDERCELFLETNSNMNEYVFKSQSHLIEPKESSLNHNKAQIKPLEDISDVNWMALEETASEIRSIASTPMPTKRSNKKLKTSVMPLPPLPKKTPVCNGIYLDLTATGISEFPLEMLDQLSNLRMLYLENNQLLKLPNELFSTLKFLHWIDVRNNKLTDLPSNIAWHPCLETILLQGNEIEKLPLQLCLIPKLKGLQVTGNPLVFPPKHIVDRGSVAVLEYLRTEWKKLYPEAKDTSKNVPKELEKDNDQVKPDFTTILCYEPKSIPKKKRVSDQLPDISSVISNSSSDANSKKKTVRQKSWEYKPSNRYENTKAVTNNTTIGKSDNCLGVKFLKCINGEDSHNFQGLKSQSLYYSYEHHNVVTVTKHLLVSQKFRSSRSFSNHKQGIKELRKVQLLNTAFQDFGHIRTNMEESFKQSTTKERMFHIITDDRIMMKLWPAQLDSTFWILEFLETYLEVIE